MVRRHFAAVPLTVDPEGAWRGLKAKRAPVRADNLIETSRRSPGRTVERGLVDVVAFPALYSTKTKASHYVGA
jgi:hypothetical protein